MKKFDLWGLLLQTFVFIGICFFASLLTCAILFISAKEKILFYSLSSGDNNTELFIEKHIDFRVNDKIRLDRSITIQEASKIVDSLNASIVK